MKRASLSREQLRYAQSRLWEIEQAEKSRIDKACELPLPKPTTAAELIRGIKSGRIKLSDNYKPDFTITRSTQVSYLFKGVIVADPHPTYDGEKRARLMKEHDRKWQAIKDELNLGDAKEVLDMIRRLDGGAK